MKGDFTRSTFKRKKHFNSVRMQQGRVQLDADWNEQLDIQAHHEQTVNHDVIGSCGVPNDETGFSIKPIADNLVIGQGRYYVDGILCENEEDVNITEQEDFPGVSLPTEKGLYLAYMDVWERHITALEEPRIREVALGGPDTATRTKIVWQVRLVKVGTLKAPVNCLSEPDAWLSEIAPSCGAMGAQSKTSDPSPGPCDISPGAGYRRLENQLYRVEIHKKGELGAATFKWSRDNGSIVTSWKDQRGNDLIVGSLGRDQVLCFASGQWVELTDDDRELRREPGTLVRLLKAEDQVLTIDPATAIPPGPVDLADFHINPKVRLWDSAGEVLVEVPSTNKGWIPLEDGIEVKFEAGSYNTGDYWLIPARTATGDVEWPRDDSEQPESQKPHGIKHHYCRLALLEFDGAEWSAQDCRHLFPPLTELTSFFYVSGDGQEAMPGEELSQPLQVGVANGQLPVANADVKFRIIPPANGALKKKRADTSTTQELKVSTGPDGLAECFWKLDAVNQSQRVEATLLDADDKTAHLPVRFNANLSRAAAVAYDPSNCAALKEAGATNLQAAVDHLCGMEKRAGCAVTVGADGQYARLDQAIVELREAGQNDISICMLPGDHVLPALDLVVKPNEKDVHLKIVGCGLGTRIILARVMKFEGLASITLKDVTIKVPLRSQRPIIFQRCSEVVLEACHLTGVMHPAGVLSEIGGSDRIRLINNVIEATKASILETFDTIFKDNDKLRKVFTAENRKEFIKTADAAVNELAKLKLGSRQKLVSNIKQKLEAKIDARASRSTSAITLSQPERESYDAFLKMMQSEIVDLQALVTNISRIREVATQTSPALALVIMDADADTTLENNEIVGVLSLYGKPAESQSSQLTEKEIKALLDKLKQAPPKISFLDSTGTFQLRNNRLTRLAIGENIVRKIRKLSTEDDKLEGIYKLSFISQNLIEAGKNWFVAKSSVLTSNSFQCVDDELNFGVVIGQDAIFTGNHSANSKGTLWCRSQLFLDDKANLFYIN